MCVLHALPLCTCTHVTSSISFGMPRSSTTTTTNHNTSVTKQYYFKVVITYDLPKILIFEASCVCQHFIAFAFRTFLSFFVAVSNLASSSSLRFFLFLCLEKKVEKFSYVLCCIKSIFKTLSSFWNGFNVKISNERTKETLPEAIHDNYCALMSKYWSTIKYFFPF